MNINHMMLPFCMTVFLVEAISLLFRKGVEGRKKGRKEGWEERKIQPLTKSIISTVPQ